MTDDVLRELLRKQPDPVENLAPDQRQVFSGWLVHIEALSARFLATGKRIVVLDCGHFVLTKALHRAGCPRCGEMIRSGYDHDGFRRLGMPDQFAWPDDPLGALNEGSREDGGGTITRAGVHQ